MIQKSKWEKEQIKHVKKAWKQNNAKYIKSHSDVSIIAEKRSRMLLSDMVITGLMEGETILPDDYPVFYGFTYVIDDNGGQVVVSNIEGTIQDLKLDIKRHSHYKANNIYNCNRFKRNIK